MNQRSLLIGETSQRHLEGLLQHPSARKYNIIVARHGPEALEKYTQCQPDLLLLDLMLPQMHGIEILRTIRTSESPSRPPCVIISCASAMVQNYRAALQAGANYFLEKPYSPDLFFELVERYFHEGLSPAPFQGRGSSDEGESCYLPRYHAPDCYLKFWGTRGSNPVAGSQYGRYGGNTCSLEVRHHRDLVIIDAGTGIRPLGQLLKSQNIRTVHLILGHTHWDHIVGFPFFELIYDSSCEIHLWSPVHFEKSTKALFTEMLAYTFFPVRLDDIKAHIIFHEMRDGTPITVGDIQIIAHPAYHPGATLCFKIRAGNKMIGYATDNEFLLGYHGNPAEIGLEHPLLEPQRLQIEFFRGCDLLIHEAQYTPLEYTHKVGWGHSSIANATVLVRHADVRHWIVTHHDPSHTDDDLDMILQIHQDVLEDCQTFCQLRMAFDGLTIPL